MDKKALRKSIRAKYSALSEEYKANADAAIYKAILSLPEYCAAKNIFCYYSVKNEVRTHRIIENARDEDKRVYLPQVFADGIMKAVEFDGTKLVRGALDIPQPEDGEKILVQSESDIAIVPALAYRRDGYRLGQGGGYYDRFLKSWKGISVGICREEMIEENIPVLHYDLPVDILITELCTIRIRKNL